MSGDTSCPAFKAVMGLDAGDAGTDFTSGTGVPGLRWAGKAVFVAAEYLVCWCGGGACSEDSDFTVQVTESVKALAVSFVR